MTMKASVILIRCSRNKSVFGARTQQMNDDDWWRTWAFAIDEDRAKREGYDLETQMNIRVVLTAVLRVLFSAINVAN